LGSGFRLSRAYICDASSVGIRDASGSCTNTSKRLVKGVSASARINYPCQCGPSSGSIYWFFRTDTDTPIDGEITSARITLERYTVTRTASQARGIHARIPVITPVWTFERQRSLQFREIPRNTLCPPHRCGAPATVQRNIAQGQQIPTRNTIQHHTTYLCRTLHSKRGMVGALTR
jgi:hypothetical protein